MRALRRSALLGIPASILLALIFGSTVATSRRFAFVALVSFADIVTMGCALRYLARRRRGEVVRRYWIGLLCTALVGLAWASPALFALPGSQNVELRAVYLLFVCGTSATYVVGTAARRLYFHTSQLPMLVPVGVVFMLSGDRVTRLLGFAVPIYFIVMMSLHHEVHGVVVSELQLREHNDEANAQLRVANEQLTKRALRDELTGLANRAGFIDTLQQAMADAHEHGSIVGVLYFDVDRLKVVNDSLGHATGDMLLVQVAERVHRMLRSTDVLARLGGDEFTMLLDKLRSTAEAVAIGERVAQSFADPFEVGGRSINVSASIGVATNVDTTDNAEVLVSFADAAQYRAKQSGRNRVEVFDIKLRAAIESRLDEEHALREGIAQTSDRRVVPARGRSPHRPLRRRGGTGPLESPGTRCARRVEVRTTGRGGRPRVRARRRDRLECRHDARRARGGRLRRWFPDLVQRVGDAPRPGYARARACGVARAHRM